jgi:c-di-GMP-binding flagellar brake protein YcgR
MRNSSLPLAHRAVNLATMPTPLDIATRLASAGQLLVRSGIEIDRILEGIAQDGATVSATLPSERMFISQLVAVNPVEQRMYLSYSDLTESNRAVLAQGSVLLKCHHRGARFSFSGRSPRSAVHGKDPAIQFAMPTQVVAVGQRFQARPARVPLQAPIECELRMGVLAFDARLVDVSLDGRGFLVHDDVIPLCAGTRISAARIRHPQREPLEVDLEIAHVTPVVLPDGKRATRIGCRILASAGDLEELIRLFIIDLL